MEKIKLRSEFGVLGFDNWYYRSNINPRAIELAFLRLLQDAEAKGYEEFTFEISESTKATKITRTISELVSSNRFIKDSGVIFHYKIPDNPIQEELEIYEKIGGLKNVWFASRNESDRQIINFKVINPEYYKEYAPPPPPDDIIIDKIKEKYANYAHTQSLFINKDSKFLKVVGVEYRVYKNERVDSLNPHGYPRLSYSECVAVVFEKQMTSEIEFNDERVLIDIDKFLDTCYIMPLKYFEFVRQIQLSYKEQDFHVLEEQISTDGFLDGTQSSIVSVGDIASMTSMRTVLDEHINVGIVTTLCLARENKIKVNEVSLVIKEQTDKIEKQKQELNKIIENEKNKIAEIHEKLNEQIAILNRKVKQLNKIIATLEVFSGINEDIIQLQSGESANIDEPVMLYQSLMFADEEFGDLNYYEQLVESNDTSIDAPILDKFENWLISSKSYNKILPTQRCIVALRPRRSNKDYCDDRFINSLMNQDKGNFGTLVYIRNGDNIYRIKTAHISGSISLFPSKVELQSIFDNLDNLEKQKQEEERDYHKKHLQQEIDKIQDSYFSYYKNMLLIQGLMFRTDIFKPLDSRLNFFDPTTYVLDNKERIRFVYDADVINETNRPSFSDWLKHINKNIKAGSRIWAIPRGSSNNNRNRISLTWEHDHNAPPMFESGVYELKVSKEEIRQYKRTYITEEEYYKAYNEDEKRRFLTGINRKTYELIHQSTSRGEKNMYVHVHVLDDQGNKILEKTIKQNLKFSYNPKDKIFNRASQSYKTREMPITFIVNPDTDDFLVNYDECVMSDIDFYLNDRNSRINYLSLIPVLWGIRRELEREKRIEDEFNMLVQQQTGATYDEVVVAIDWYKDKVVKVNKRGIEKNNVKALTMITQRLQQQRGNYQHDLRTKVLCYKYGNKSYVATGFYKHEFVNHVYTELELRRFLGGGISKKHIKDNTVIVDSERYEVCKGSPRRVFAI